VLGGWFGILTGTDIGGVVEGETVTVSGCFWPPPPPLPGAEAMHPVNVSTEDKTIARRQS